MPDASQLKLDVAQSGLTPWKLIQASGLRSGSVHEDSKWTDGFDTAYQHVIKLGGPGDKGRDVAGYVGDPQTDCEWHSYQCKHYDHALMPSDVYTELGKLGSQP